MKKPVMQRVQLVALWQVKQGATHGTHTPELAKV